LKPKEEEIGLSKVKDNFNIQPNWSMDRYRRVKTWDSKFKDAPQVIIPVIRLISDQGKGCIDLGR
jgi:hypothetical protein